MDATRLRNEVRDERDRRRRADRGQALLDLGPMSMSVEAVRAGRLGQLGEQVVGAGAASRSADARLGVDDHVTGETPQRANGTRASRAAVG